MDAETTRLKDETNARKAEEKELRLALRGGAGQVPLPELKATVTALEEQKEGIATRLDKLKGGNIKAVSLEERESIGKEHRKWQKTANARKNIRTELWQEIVSAIEKDKIEDTKEELGLEF